MSKIDPNMIPSVWRVHWKKVKTDKRFVIETEYRTKLGKLIPMEVTATYLQYGGEEFNYVFARDISERKQAEAVRERFTVQLRTAAEIAEQVGAILDPDDLLNTVIPLLKDRFNLYHAHVYILEDDTLVLRAGYGRIGSIMVQQSHQIALHHPHSLVARAARNREAVVINDVSKAPDFLPNMLLPKTRSEVAVPIIIGDQVLGVLDVQSDQLDFFTPSDLDVFRTLSGQLANALYSATLFDRQAAVREEYRNSAKTVRAIFNAMTEGIMVTDMMGRIVDLNDAALVLYGYDEREELLNRSVMELVTQTGWPRLAESMRQTLDSGEGQVQEYLMLRKDGDTFDAEQSTALLWGAEDNPQGVVLITRDVTERKRARQEIARFEALASHAVDAIVMADLSGNIIYANRASYRLFGYDAKAASMVGMNLLALWPTDQAHILLEEALPQAGSGGWQGEASQRREEGDTFEAALTFFSVLGENGEPISVATIVRDITDRKRAEADLQRFALQLRTAADVSVNITAILDPTVLLEAIVPLVQERFHLYHLHVYTLDETDQMLVMQVGSGEAGRVMREQGHQIALDQRPSLVAKAARTREIVLVEDVTQEPTHMPNPLLPDTRTEIAIPMLAGDEVIGVFDVQDNRPGRFRDSEVDVFSALAGQIAIALRNARYFEEIQEAAENLREIDRLKSEFLANMSHELRTPLNSILGYAEVMLMGIDGELTPEMEEDAEAIFENGQQLLQLINDILDLTKIEAGRMTLAKEPLAVGPLLEEVQTNIQGLLHKDPKPVEVLVSSEGDIPEIVADKVRVAQILNNLVSNALKFTDEGYVHVRARHDASAGFVCIEVQDTGVGIADEDLVHLFERFRQVDGSSTRRAEGTGLGLAITKHLVEMHGGQLTVHSEVHKGSLFTVCLPVQTVA
jgi:PAS domain S-box-containing protein